MTKMTRNQKAVLTKLGEARAGLFGRDFAEIATVTSGRWEWAQPILRALAARGFAETVGPKTYQGTAWKITKTGRAALKAAVLPVSRKPGKLSATMHNELICTGRSQARGYPYERCGLRVTHEALEARGLVTIETRDSGWRHLRLTEAGIAMFQEITGKTLTIPEEIGDE